MAPEYYIATKPYARDYECGDIGVIKTYDDKVFMGLVDILGHGTKAHEVAINCKRYMDENYHMDLKAIMMGLHERLCGDRGAVVGLCRIDLNTMGLRYVGVGNITARIFGPNSMRLISLPGVVGQALPRLKMFEVKISTDDVAVMYTDGVKENFDLKDYPSMFQHDVKTMVKNIIRLFGKNSDDAACMAVRIR